MLKRELPAHPRGAVSEAVLCVISLQSPGEPARLYSGAVHSSDTLNAESFPFVRRAKEGGPSAQCSREGRRGLPGCQQGKRDGALTGPTLSSSVALHHHCYEQASLSCLANKQRNAGRDVVRKVQSFRLGFGSPGPDMPFGPGCGGGWPCPRQEPAPCSGPGCAPSYPGTGQEVVACILLVSLLGDRGRGLPPGTRREQRSSLAGSTRPSGRAPGFSPGREGPRPSARRKARMPAALQVGGFPGPGGLATASGELGALTQGPHTGSRVPAGPRVGVPGSSQRGRRAWAGGRGPGTTGCSQRGPCVRGPAGCRLPRLRHSAARRRRHAITHLHLPRQARRLRGLHAISSPVTLAHRCLSSLCLGGGPVLHLLKGHLCPTLKAGGSVGPRRLLFLTMSALTGSLAA